MPAQKLIAIKEICLHHNISPGFINELYQNDVIELITIKRTKYIDEKKLLALEKVLRLVNELSINVEGVSTILQLLTVLESKENEIKSLTNRLAFYIPQQGS